MSISQDYQDGNPEEINRAVSLPSFLRRLTMLDTYAAEEAWTLLSVVLRKYISTSELMTFLKARFFPSTGASSSEESTHYISM